MIETPHLTLAHRLAGLFRQFPQVEAVCLGGSRTSGAAADTVSDIDLYVYTTALVPLEDRLALVERSGGASRADMNLTFWDLGDEWFDATTGIEVDVTYWDTGWAGEMLDRVLVRQQGSTGYSTAHWRTFRDSTILFDHSGWYARLQERAHQPYPEALRSDIIEKNHALLRQVIPAYLYQIEKAVRRGDLYSVNHRVAAFLASYFDILFAANRVLHPGEKRLIDFAVWLCPSLPEDMPTQVMDVLQAAGAPDGGVVEKLNRLADGLDVWLEKIR